jgi:hypothetical protein
MNGCIEIMKEVVEGKRDICEFIDIPETGDYRIIELNTQYEPEI